VARRKKGEDTKEPAVKEESALQVKMTKEQSAFFASMDKLVPGSVATATSLRRDLPRISTGNFGLDVATYGGIPQGRISRFWGKPKSSKSGESLSTAASFQRNYCSECFQRECDCKHRGVPLVFYIDAENKMLDQLSWVEAHGVILDGFKVMAPSSGQNIVDCVDMILRSPQIAKCGLVIVDSLANLSSQDELSKLASDGPTVGRNAWLINLAFRKWATAITSLGVANKRKTTIIAINQLRSKVGVTYGSPDTMPGGMGQEYGSSLDVRFDAAGGAYLMFNEKKQKFEAKLKGFKSTFKPGPDMTPDFTLVNYRVSASAVCPSGRSGSFNYWLKPQHGHHPGDPDNGLQLWNYSKRYLLQTEGHTKKIQGTAIEARTLDELETSFRASPEAQKSVWPILMEKLCKDDHVNATNDAIEDEETLEV